MNAKFSAYVWLLLLIFLSLLLILMCDSDSTKPQDGVEIMDVTGSWELRTTITSNTFGLPNGETNTEFIYLSDSSGVLSIFNFDGHGVIIV